MDRQPDQTPGRQPLRDQSHAAQSDEQVVGYQPDAVEGAEGGWAAYSGRPGGGADGKHLRLTSFDPVLPTYIGKALKTNLRAWQYFQALAPTYRRDFVVWIHTAKRPETREKRIRESIELLSAGKKLGLK